MANETSNYHLKKPEQGDFYNVDVQNENMDILDNELKKLKDRFVQGTATITRWNDWYDATNGYFIDRYSTVSVSFPEGSQQEQTNSQNYDVILCITEADNIDAVGRMEVYNKTNSGFTVRCTGSAWWVTFTWTIINTTII